MAGQGVAVTRGAFVRRETRPRSFENGQNYGKMIWMKSQAIPRTGIIDAIGTGLTEAARRPLLWIVPIVVDLALWLAPRLSITALTTQLMDAWRALLPMVYTPEQMAGAKEGIDLVQTGMIDLVKSVNLGTLLTSGWLAPPSAFAPVQASRYFLISDAVLAPVGLGIDVKSLTMTPWQTPIQIGSILGVIAVVALLWIISHMLTATFFTMVASALQSRPVGGKQVDISRPAGSRTQEEGFRGWLHLVGRFAVVSLFASFAAFMLRLPLVLVTALAVFSGGGAASLLFVLGGGITLWLTMWFLSSLFFVGDAFAFDRLPLWPGLMQSLILVRANGFRALALAILINVLLLGARTVWGMVGNNPAGALIAIIVNGYLATAMTIGIYVYYLDLRRHWQAAQVGRQLSK